MRLWYKLEGLILTEADEFIRSTRVDVKEHVGGTKSTELFERMFENENGGREPKARGDVLRLSIYVLM